MASTQPATQKANSDTCAKKVPKICSKIFHRKNYFYSTSLTCPQSLVQDCKLCPPLESLDHFSSRVSKSIQYKKCYLLFSCTFLPLFIVFIKKNCFLSFSFPFFFFVDEISNFRNKILIHQSETRTGDKELSLELHARQESPLSEDRVFKVLCYL